VRLKTTFATLVSYDHRYHALRWKWELETPAKEPNSLPAGELSCGDFGEARFDRWSPHNSCRRSLRDAAEAGVVRVPAPFSRRRQTTGDEEQRANAGR
jgi:hypothetical protein